VHALHPALLEEVRQLAANNPDTTVSVATAQGVYVWVSPAHTRFFGFAADELIGHSYRDFAIDPVNLDIGMADVELNAESEKMRFGFRTKSGVVKNVRSQGRTVDDPETGEPYADPATGDAYILVQSVFI
jgi:PAS domain S-box-containing protein